MNRTVAFVVLSVLVALGIAGYVVLTIFDRDPADFVTTLLILLGLAATAGGLQTGLDQIKRQTNGTLSALLERNRELEEENTQLRVRYTAATGTSAPVDYAPPGSGSIPLP